MNGPIDLTAAGGDAGPLWGMQSDDLNATLLSWPAGGGVAEHVNDQLDVLIVVLDGTASVTLDGSAHPLSAGHLLLIPRGCARAVEAGSEGVRYLSIHRRRGPLLPAGRPGSEQGDSAARE